MPLPGEDATGYVVQGQGQHFQLRHMRDLEPKQVGKHRLVVFVGYRISLQAALGAERGVQVNMDSENLVSFGIGCWDCEKEFKDCKTDPVCPVINPPDA